MDKTDKTDGVLFLIIGNSGSGKDSLIQEVIKIWPEDKIPLRAATRYITRTTHESEPHVSVSPDVFHRLKNEGNFFLTWHSYDFDYGIGKEVLSWISQGIHVMANISRTVVTEVRKKIPRVKVIFISVPLETTICRLKKRKREPVDSHLYFKRLLRAKNNQENFDADFMIENTGSLQKSVQKLCDYMHSVVKQKD